MDALFRERTGEFGSEYVYDIERGGPVRAEGVPGGLLNLDLR
jgi:hypothetical protein